MKRRVIFLKVKMVCDRDNESRVVDLPMDEDELLRIQGRVLDRDTLGFIGSENIYYYDEEGNEIDNIFLLNRRLQK